jgi:uncharacterized membrane protein
VNEHDPSASAAVPSTGVAPLASTLGLGHRTRSALRHQPAPYWLAIIASVSFGIVFGRLGVRHHTNFGSWSFDLAIYDQAFWLASKFGKTFITVRGLELWGHHTNFIAYLFAPAYWLGAGPRFLFVAQAVIIGLGGIPVYLIARDRLENAWLGLGFTIAYLMYAPVQFISWANFHPEALVFTPLLFAWWCARKHYWKATIIFLLLALSTREDTALAVVMMGVVLILISLAQFRDHLPTIKWGAGIAVLGAAFYLVSTKGIIKYYNNGMDPFYVKFFYGEFGSTSFEVAKNMASNPDKVISLAIEKDRLDFYKKLMLPLGGLPLLGLPFLLMGAPQMLASVTGTSPYARMIEYQYPSVMIAPILIAAIEGTAACLRTRVRRTIAIVWLLLSTYVSNVAWSPSPIGRKAFYWASPSALVAPQREAVALVPNDARVTGTYQILPHLAHRKYAYDWPNPWVPTLWGNDLDDGTQWPKPHDPATVDWLVLDRSHIGEAETELVERLIGPGGEFTVMFERDGIVAAKRARPPTAELPTPVVGL